MKNRWLKDEESFTGPKGYGAQCLRKTVATRLRWEHMQGTEWMVGEQYHPEECPDPECQANFTTPDEEGNYPERLFTPLSK
jgi:hypothetical protein